MESDHIRDQRMRRDEVMDRLKRGSTTLSRILQEAQADDAIGGMRVAALLESLPGIGEAEARHIMNRLGIAQSGLVRELSAAQRTALENEHSGPTEVIGSTPTRDYEDDEDIEPEETPQNGEGYGIEDWDRL